MNYDIIIRMKKILLNPVSYKNYALVDDEDYHHLSQWKWKLSTGYAVRQIAMGYPGGKQKKRTVYMHREIIKSGFDVDHKNGNRLDNRKINLRACSRSQNSFNSGPQSDNTSGYKGVTWHKSANKWAAQINVDGGHYWLGVYSDIKEAAKAYNKAALKHRGEFAWLNEI